MVENKFEMLMAAQTDMTPDELATQARNILISSAYTFFSPQERTQETGMHLINNMPNV